MKKLLLALLFTPVLALAGVSTYGGGVYQQTGIITPDIATGARLFEQFSTTSSGQMVVCHKRDWSFGSDKCGAWKTLVQTVPADKVYVGFRIGNTEYGRTVVIIYYKDK